MHCQVISTSKSKGAHYMTESRPCTDSSLGAPALPPLPPNCHSNEVHSGVFTGHGHYVECMACTVWMADCTVQHAFVCCVQRMRCTVHMVDMVHRKGQCE